MIWDVRWREVKPPPVMQLGRHRRHETGDEITDRVQTAGVVLQGAKCKFTREAGQGAVGYCCNRKAPSQEKRRVEERLVLPKVSSSELPR